MASIMSTCVESIGSNSQISSNSEIKTSNINIVVASFSNDTNRYHKYNNEVTISGLPALQTLSTLNCSDIGIDVNSYDCPAKTQCQEGIKANLSSVASSSPTTTTAHISSNTLQRRPFIPIPFGWKREEVNGRIVYYSPTNVCIQSMDQLSTYLQTEGTDKTGLECPLHIEIAFSFDVSIPSKAYDIEESKLSKHFCNQKQRIIALATYRQYSLQSQQLIAEENRNRVQIQSEVAVGKQSSVTNSHGKPNIQTGDSCGAQQTLSFCESEDLTSKLSSQQSADSFSLVETNCNFDKCDQPIPKCADLLPQTVDRFPIAGHQQYVRQLANCENHCQYSVPIGNESHREGISSFCIYDQSGSGGVFSVSACDSSQMTVHPNGNKTSIYLAPQNTSNYGQMVYESPNVNLIQSSHPQVITADDYNHLNHAFHQSDQMCNTGLTSIPSYLPLASANANTSAGAISFNANGLPPNAITLSPSYQSQEASHCHSQSNISIMPANPPMPPISVPNVTSVTTSVNDVIPAVGIGPQIINTTNTSGAPQVLQFINSVPLTQITANTVTVLQQSPAQEVTVPATTLIIPQLMASHDHQMVINHAMNPQTTVFPHIATAAGFAFPSAINLTNAIALPQRTISETCKPSRSRRRKEYTRTNRTHPPTVASILKRADNEKKQKELNDKQIHHKDQELQTISENIESHCEPDDHHKESISVAVQSELAADSDNYW